MVVGLQQTAIASLETLQAMGVVLVARHLGERLVALFGHAFVDGGARAASAKVLAKDVCRQRPNGVCRLPRLAAPAAPRDGV